MGSQVVGAASSPRSQTGLQIADQAVGAASSPRFSRSSPQAHKPQSKRLRLGRVSESGRIYLATTTTLRRRDVFADLRLGRAVVRALMHSDSLGHTKTLAYVLMPDHLHWLFELGEGIALDEVMRAVKGYSAKEINRLTQSEGALWQPGYHDHALRADEDIRHVARYVVANPLRARLVHRLGDYSLWDAAWV